MYRVSTVTENGEEQTQPLFVNVTRGRGRRLNARRYHVEPIEIFHVPSQPMNLPLIGFYKIVTDESDPNLFMTYKMLQATTGNGSISECVGPGKKVTTPIVNYLYVPRASIGANQTFINPYQQRDDNNHSILHTQAQLRSPPESVAVIDHDAAMTRATASSSVANDAALLLEACVDDKQNSNNMTPTTEGVNITPGAMNAAPLMSSSPQEEDEEEVSTVPKTTSPSPKIVIITPNTVRPSPKAISIAPEATNATNSPPKIVSSVSRTPITVPPVLKYPTSFPAPAPSASATGSHSANGIVEQFVAMNSAYMENYPRPTPMPNYLISVPPAHAIVTPSSQTNVQTDRMAPLFYFDRTEKCYYYQKRLPRPNSTLPGKWHILVQNDHATTVWYLLVDNIHLLDAPLVRQYVSHYKGRQNGLLTLMAIYTDGDERDRGHVGTQLIHLLMPYLHLLVHDSINWYPKDLIDPGTHPSTRVTIKFGDLASTTPCRNCTLPTSTLASTKHARAGLCIQCYNKPLQRGERDMHDSEYVEHE